MSELLNAIGVIAATGLILLWVYVEGEENE